MASELIHSPNGWKLVMAGRGKGEGPILRHYGEKLPGFVQ